MPALTARLLALGSRERFLRSDLYGIIWTITLDLLLRRANSCLKEVIATNGKGRMVRQGKAGQESRQSWIERIVCVAMHTWNYDDHEFLLSCIDRILSVFLRVSVRIFMRLIPHVRTQEHLYIAFSVFN